jgi:hypothetical protein
MSTRPDWLRPVEYYEPRAETEIETAAEDDTAPPQDGRRRIDRAAARPAVQSRDRSPMVYRKGRPDAVIDVEDDDELGEES